MQSYFQAFPHSKRKSCILNLRFSRWLFKKKQNLHSIKEITKNKKVLY